MVTTIRKLKKNNPKTKQANQSFNLLCRAIVAHAEAVKSVLKAQPQSAVVDADHPADVNPGDAVSLKV